MKYKAALAVLLLASNVFAQGTAATGKPMVLKALSPQKEMSHKTLIKPKLHSVFRSKEQSKTNSS